MTSSGPHHPATLPLGSIGSDDYRALILKRQDALRLEIERFIPPDLPFVWELGSGHGHFLTAYAWRHPEKICAGVDLVSERVQRALRKRDRATLPNLHFYRADARLFLQTLSASRRFGEIFVLFPDPWPKLRHHKHRIMQAAFLDLLAERAAPECRLYFRTDYAPYFEATDAIIRQHPRWALVEDPWPFEFETVFQRRARWHQSLVARLRP